MGYLYMICRKVRYLQEADWNDTQNKESKPYEQTQSAVKKVTAQLHRVGLFNIDTMCIQNVINISSNPEYNILTIPC